MTTLNDCPICMDSIEFKKNCVTTECGHCFHANCLMQSVAHNGFGCPYCRTQMATKPDDSLSDYSDEDDESSIEETIDDYVLRGFRFLFNQVNGVVNTLEDEEDEADANFISYDDDDDDYETDEENVENSTNVLAPSTNYVAEKLRDQGITFEQLVEMMCHLDHDEYTNDELAERFSDELFGKIRIIVSNYHPTTQETTTQETSTQETSTQETSTQETTTQETTIIYELTITDPRFMTHV
jgi:hypothetical protein